ncbi:MAG: hypothetical protein MUE81_20145, partial [Thermoflexibacter sp.]|nr:hypothetical protein [Thermoflexibacter sp.]
MALDYYWVGGSGNWGDVNHWATTSGGAIFHVNPPTIGDDVFFDINSFPSPVSKTVTIDVNAQCRNMSWSGVTNSPILTGTSSFTLTIFGNLAFVNAMSNTFAGKIIFSALAANQTITSAGQSLADVEFTVSTNVANAGYMLQDNFSVNNLISLIEGIFNTNGFAVTCANLTTDESNSETRTLNLSNSTVTITGSGESLNLRGDDATLTLTTNASTSILLTGTGSITMYPGLQAKTIPSMTFVNATTIVIDGETGGGLLNFGNITVNQNGANFTVIGNAPKTYGNLTFGNNVIATFNGGIGVATFGGTVNFGSNATTTFNNNNVFNQTVTFGNSAIGINFTGANTLNSSLNIGSSSTVNFSGTGVANVFTNTINVGASTNINFSNVGTNTFNNANLNTSVIWRFSSGGTSTINGIFTTSANCNSPIAISSDITGTAANLNLVNNQTWSFVSLRDINEVGAGTLTITNGGDLGNNTNASFTTASRNLFWVGGTGNWNDSAKWSLTSGGAGGQCPPTSIDN